MFRCGRYSLSIVGLSKRSVNYWCHARDEPLHLSLLRRTHLDLGPPWPCAAPLRGQDRIEEYHFTDRTEGLLVNRIWELWLLDNQNVPTEYVIQKESPMFAVKRDSSVYHLLQPRCNETFCGQVLQPIGSLNPTPIQPQNKAICKTCLRVWERLPVRPVKVPLESTGDRGRLEK